MNAPMDILGHTVKNDLPVRDFAKTEAFRILGVLPTVPTRLLWDVLARVGVII